MKKIKENLMLLMTNKLRVIVFDSRSTYIDEIYRSRVIYQKQLVTMSSMKVAPGSTVTEDSCGPRIFEFSISQVAKGRTIIPRVTKTLIKLTLENIKYMI